MSVTLEQARGGGIRGFAPSPFNGKFFNMLGSARVFEKTT